MGEINKKSTAAKINRESLSIFMKEIMKQAKKEDISRMKMCSRLNMSYKVFNSKVHRIIHDAPWGPKTVQFVNECAKVVGLKKRIKHYNIRKDLKRNYEQARKKVIVVMGMDDISSREMAKILKCSHEYVCSHVNGHRDFVSSEEMKRFIDRVKKGIPASRVRDIADRLS